MDVEAEAGRGGSGRFSVEAEARKSYRFRIGSGVAKRGRSAPGGTFMGAELWAMVLQAINLQRLY